MSYITIIKVCLIVIDFKAKSDQSTPCPEIWSLFLASMVKIARLRYRQRDQFSYLVQPEIKVKIFINTPVNSDGRPQNIMDCLPNELIYAIGEYINCQKTLKNLASINLRSNAILSPLLLKSPYLTSPKSILSFLSSRDKHAVQNIIFGPTLIGNLASSIKSNRDTLELIPYVYSGLYRLLIDDRQSKALSHNLVHPIFYNLSDSISENCVVEEYCSHKEISILDLLRLSNEKQANKGRTAIVATTNLRFIRNSSGQVIEISRVPSNSLTLSLLIRECRKWQLGYPEWTCLKNSISNSYLVCKILLEWYQGEHHPIWKELGSSMARKTKHVISRQITHLLSHIHTTLILQVRFVTSNSQRLLDAYSFIYYRVLSLAQDLRVQNLVDAMSLDGLGCTEVDSAIQGKESEPFSNIVQISSLSINQHTTSIHQHTTSIQQNTTNGPANKNQIGTSIQCKNITEAEAQQSPNNSIDRVTKAAYLIYEALIIIFNLRIPIKSSTLIQNIHYPIEMLQSILITYAPSMINAETVELISRVTAINLDPNSQSYTTLQNWIEWLREIVGWYDASIEMEPVKDLLRISMAKIDELRGLQVFLY